jgi:magnesium-transporting ATPase (P-type)
MGLRGTDVARESAEIVLTDDDFASIVAGVEEGRIAYGNVRKVVYLLISCGAAEIVIFILSLAAGLPMPLVAVQLLWLNLVTNGIQDVALAFEPGEGDELRRRPRPPEEPLMDRSMVEQCVISAAVMGVVSFLAFAWLLDHGRTLEAARNEVLLLYVLFENCHLGNVRSETRSAFAVSPFRNPYLVLGAVVAQALHIGAMHTPGLRDVLRIEPVSVAGWLGLLAVSTTVVLAMEAYKLVRGRTRAEPAPGGAAPGGAAAA